MKIKSNLTLLTYLSVVSLLIVSTTTQSSCHILCNCVNSTCQSCYENFQSNSQTLAAVGAMCPCPQGFFSNADMCKFCPDNCRSCSASDTCIECYPGYTKINGTCQAAKYYQESTSLTYQTNKDFKYLNTLMPSTYGFELLPKDPTITSFVVNCSKAISSMTYGVKSIGNLSLSLVRVYRGLPYHQWVHLSINYFVLDSWNGQNVEFSLYMDRSLVNKTYNNTLRSGDICGGPQPDSLDQTHSFISHSSQSLAINITIPPNITFSLSSIKLDMGTCQRNCLTCTSPILCLTCAKNYKIINGTCQCDTNFGIVVSYGCVEKCGNGSVFIPGLQRCVLCAIYLTDCYRCENTTTCLECNDNLFLDNGVCVSICSQGTFPKKAADSLSAVPHCHACPTNCSSCFNQTFCLTCNQGSFLSQGQCLTACPAGTLLSGSKCYTSTACGIGCQTCNFVSCTQCQVGYWNNQGICRDQCQIGKYEIANGVCQSCSSNCIMCVDSNTCQQCSVGYMLKNGTCQTYNSVCTLVGHYYDARVRNCIKCPNNCSSCFRSLCYVCFDGFFLDNGKCVATCSDEKYKIDDAILTNNVCYWRSQICQIASSMAQKNCTKCRSLDYTLALNSDQKCQTWCPSTKTFSASSSILTQTSRTCTVSCLSNCQICIDPLKCVLCSTNYSISISANNTYSCVQSCPSGYVSDSVQCIPCQLRCSSCDLNGNCLTWDQNPGTINCSASCQMCFDNVTCAFCKSGLFLKDNACESVCPGGTFPDSVSRQCRKCAPQCQYCNTFSQCTSCIDGYFLSQQVCVRECPQGKYPNPQTLTCDSCSSNCRTCFGPKQHQCLTCYLGNKKDHSQCVSTCPVHKYQDSQGYCDWCHEACRYCFGPAQFQCLECDKGNYVYRYECYPNSCPAATYLAIPSIRECKDCAWGCAVCTSPTTCQQCFSGFYLSNQQCLDVCPIGTYYSWTNLSCTACSSNCTSCTQTSCYQCQSPSLLYNGTCISTCPNGTFSLNYYYGLQCRACRQQCLACQTSYQCITCKSGFVLKSGQCTKQCEAGKYFDLITNTCKSCSGGCVACTTWGCSQCQAGYYFYNNYCVPNCPAGSFSIPQTLQCTNCPSACTSCLTLYQCTQCKTGYTLISGICRNETQECNINCQQCSDANNCLICKTGYYRITNNSGMFCINNCTDGSYINNKQCIPCQPQCLTCNTDIGCMACKTGLILFMGQCIADCYPGFYSAIVNSTVGCYPCSPNCLRCSQSANNCTLCSSSTAIVENGNCKQKTDCSISQFYSSALGYCLPCTAHCKTCSNPTQCQQCLPTYYITEQKQCRLSCPEGTYLSFSLSNPSIQQCQPCPVLCLSCTSASQCTNCLPGYPMNTTNFQCQTNCDRDIRYFYNSATNKCQKCADKCYECVGNSNACTSCPTQYYLIGTDCVRQCPQGTFPAANVRACLPCAENCQICTSQSNCQVCQGFTAIFNGTCLNDCPSGYYSSNGVCLPCVSPCRSCSGGSIYECQTCQIGYFYFNGRCTENCPQGYFKNELTGSCRNCPVSCKTCTSFTNCQTCSTGYTYNSLTKSCENTPSCPQTLPTCKSCFTNTTTNSIQCSNCFPGYYLHNGQCLTQCGDNYYENILSGQCEPCDTNCTNCGGVNMCTECLSGFYIFNGKCYQVCPEGTYGVTQIQGTVTVQSCKVDPCVHYITVYSVRQCVVCVAPYLVNDGSCVLECPSGKYQSELQCKPCRTGCSKCADWTHCTECLTPTYHFYKMECVENCPSGTYSYQPPTNSTNTSIQNGQCLPCALPCFTCTNSTNCTQCITGYYLTQQGNCALQCLNSTFSNPDTKKCDRCAPNCLNCTTLQFCTLCKSGTYLVNGQCVSQCPSGMYLSSGQCVLCKQNCRLCDSSSNCTQCSSGYLLNRVTNQCVKQCPAGTYLNAYKQCQGCSSSCLLCSNPTQCLSCKSPFILFNGQCVSSCPSGYTQIQNPLSCKECNPYCKQCSINPDNCTVCPSGYTLVNNFCRNSCPSHTFLNSSNQCQPCSTNTTNTRCSECFGAAADQCIQCYSPYFVYNGVCIDRCADGMYGSIIGGVMQCGACDVKCVTCQGKADNCTKCPWGYFLINGTCLSSCPNGYFANPDPTISSCLPCQPPCLVCLSSTSCKICQSGYYLTPTSTCTSNCSSLSTSTTSYITSPLNSSCIPCPSNCMTCSYSSSTSTIPKCTQCTLPYHLYLSQCVFDCPTTTYYNSTLNSCQKCTQNYCVACNSLTQCTECLGAYLLNGDCVNNCPTGWKNVGGVCVVDRDNSTVCSGYWFNFTDSGVPECGQYCPYGYYPSTTSTPPQCQPCSSSCLSCTNPTNCQICSPPYKLFNNTCLNICPTGYIPSDSTCVKCNDKCLACSPSPTQCISCLAPYFLFNSQCINVCPDGYYPDTATRQCKPCKLSCAKCSNSNDCTQCANSRYTPPSCSDNTCLSNQYKIQATGQCSNCDSNCLTCNGGSSSNCLTCRSPLVLMQGQCRSICPQNFALATNNSCVPCQFGCKVCAYNTPTPNCTECHPQYVLNSNKCLEDCTLIQTESQAYTTNGESCFPCSINCIDCTLVDGATGQTNCMQCAAGWILYMGTCVNQCPSGFYSLQRGCYRCPENCTQCSSIINSCRGCENNTFLHMGNCIQQCPSGTYTDQTLKKCIPCSDSQCKKCSVSIGQCEQCNSPYSLTLSSGVSNCKNCSVGFLFDMNSQACLPCFQGCLNCAVKLDNCTSCVGERLLVDGRCVDKCPVGYYPVTSSTPKKCLPCPTNCTSCSPNPTTPTTLDCYTCQPGFYHNTTTHKCLQQCPSGTYITNVTDCSECSINCSKCVSNTQCSICKTGYYLMNGYCVNVCPDGYVGANGVCEICMTGCKKCVGLTNCTECRSDYVLTANKTCEQIQQCPAGKYADINGTCQSCPSNCLLCTTATNCTQCISTLYLSNGICSQTCQQNQYNISISVSSTISRICIDCTSPCDACKNSTSCTHCISDYYLNGTTCVADCGDFYYGRSVTVNGTVNRDCVRCQDRLCRLCTVNGCKECNSGYYLFGYIPYNQTNGTCYQECPSGYFKDLTTTPLQCKQCQTPNCDKCQTSQTCLKCKSPYILLTLNNITTCVTTCPDNMLTITTNNITKCQYCLNNCIQCHSEQWCIKCDVGFYLYVVQNLTVGNVSNFNSICVRDCPDLYYESVDVLNTQNSTCEKCEIYCKQCSNANNCTQCISEAYVLISSDCVPYRCLNCTRCVNQRCQECDNGFYLLQSDGRCYQTCPDTFFNNNATKKCEQCMDFCVKCPNKTLCDRCIDGYNFTGQVCVDEAFVLYGSLSNMSGFTSNITEITAAVYLGTSVGPMMFGEMTTTYFNIQFCQFILFHAKASGENKQMQMFLDSLQSISLTVPPTSGGGSRRLLASALSDPLAFLATSAPIFAMMGGFLGLYFIVLLVENYAIKCSESCPRIYFYTTQICAFMKKRFKWIYFDFIAWISYLPFVYFSLMQLQSFSFDTFLQGLSCILSIIIIVAYPLYPFFIIYLLKQNYNDLVQENNQLVEMSLSPYVYKVKRPSKQLIPGQPCKDYFTAENFRLMYDPLKYIRKFIFVTIVATCHQPVTSLVILIILNIIFIAYLAVFRPRVMPYLVFDFIIEGILLFFEIFMLVYLTNDSTKVTAMSIAAQAIGFITANLSLIIAIILNLIAYYKIFMCIYDLYKHLATKLEEKQKGQMKDQQEIPHSDHDMPEKDQDLTKSLKGVNRVKNLNGDDMTEFDFSENHQSGLIKDKQIFGDGSRGDSGIRNSKGGLPDLKSTRKLKKQQNQRPNKAMEQDSSNHLFEDKELPKRQARVQDDDDLTESNPNSNVTKKVDSGIFKDKQLYKNNTKDGLRNSSNDQIPNLKQSNKKGTFKNMENPQPMASGAKLKKVVESDDDIMLQSQVSSEDNMIKDGKLIEGGGNKYKRESVKNPNEYIVSQGIPIANTKDKFRRNTNINSLKKVDSVGKNLEDQDDDFIQDQKMKQLDKKKQENQETQIGNLRTYEKQKQDKNKLESGQKQVEEGRLTNREKQNKKNTNKNKNKNQNENENENENEIEDPYYVPRSKNGSKDKKNMLDIPVIGKNTKGSRPQDSMDLLQASFVQKQDNVMKNNEDKEDQQIESGKYVDKNKKAKKLAQDKQRQIEQGRLAQKTKAKRNAEQDFDQFMQQKQKEPTSITTKQRSAHKNSKQNQQKNEQQDTEQLKTKQRQKANKMSSNKEQSPKQKQLEIEGGTLIQVKGNKFRRNVPALVEDKEKDVDELGFKQRQKGKYQGKAQNNIQDQEALQEANVKERRHKKVQKFADQLNDGQIDEVEQHGGNNAKKNKKYLSPGDQQLGDQYERKQRRQEREVKKKRGHLGVSQGVDEQYDEIKKQNKQKMFSPDKGAANLMMGSIDINDFDGSDYEQRPESKVQRPGSRGKGNLGVSQNDSANDSDDSSSVRRQRVSAIQRLRKKQQGNLGIEQKSEYSGEQSASSRPQKKKEQRRRRRQKSGILQVNKKEADEDVMNSIQLQKSKR